MSNNDDASECQSLSTDALPMAPRQLPVDNSQPIPPRANEENQDEQSSTEHLQQPTQSPFNLPNPPTDWNFNIFLNKIADSLTMEDLVNMKWFFEGEGGLGKGVLEKIKTPQDLFRIMRTRGYITRDNLLYLQGILYQAGRKDLIQDGVEYAKSLGNVVHFYAPTYLPENGYKYVKFHVDGKDFTNYSRNDVENLRRIVSAILFVPQHFVFICGIEPSSSLVITLMIPDLYVEILQEMLEDGDVMTTLHETGVDIIDINGQTSYNIKKGTGDTNTVEREQEIKLVNVYEQLKQTQQSLDTSEMTCIDLYRQIDDMKHTIDETKENLSNMENKVYALKKVLSMSKDATEPASLKELSSLEDFTECLDHFRAQNIDKKVVRRMLDATVNIVSNRVRESHRMQEENLILGLQDMQSQLMPLKFEVEKFKFLDSLSKIDKSVLGRMQELLKPFIGQREVSLTPLGMQMLANISSKLHKKEKEKLKKKYQWTPNGEIERFMEQDQNLLLAGIFYKEITTKQTDINFESFISQCLSEVGREDLKTFLDPRHYLSHPSPRNAAEAKDAAQWQTLYMQQQQQQEQQQQKHQQQKHQQQQKQAHHQGHRQKQGEQQNQQQVINRMALQIEEMYSLMLTRQKMFEPKLDNWKSPIFPFSSDAFQQK
ncbi:uncharacterized protein LOC132731444 [Ruditapes philippinarum]|uniref:uncharacterized protein LOC132731444 n=1 Tax=Ruditapes philippinarum TaxID=129788 RepID=UPI00295AA723|nr:uncharacterized protein LOC132731444 [Ruditapes philippinarum]